ncbi:hypothetical protein CTI12_AA117010 [Artemisia annua]|uniref:Uncharacterized protein n=1 Tax=Artemisia annua TaxID=35608 RepID=A0A2U1PSW9_ARTAN|nr:hypothetical protein CTI12_AA117010 [Artemisia annua]
MAVSSKNKDFSKIVITDDMVDYVLGKYSNKCYDDEEMTQVILEDLWQRENDQHDVAKDKVLESLETLGKRVSKFEVMFGSLKEIKEAKMAMEAEAIVKPDEVLEGPRRHRNHTNKKRT